MELNKIFDKRVPIELVFYNFLKFLQTFVIDADDVLLKLFGSRSLARAVSKRKASFLTNLRLPALQDWDLRCCACLVV